MTKPIVWSIAGSDSSGGAGIQADLKTIDSLAVQGCTVITAITAQNSRAVSQVEFVSEAMLRAQLEALITDLPPRAIKIGMLGDESTIRVVAEYLEKICEQYPETLIVYDPVLTASTGDSLASEGNQHLCNVLQTHLFPHVHLLTPNIPEVEWLTGKACLTTEDVEKAAKKLHKLGVKALCIKGGHNSGLLSQDYVSLGDWKCIGSPQKFWLSQQRFSTPDTHGTGCTFASAVAATYGKGATLEDAIVLAKAYITGAIKNAPLSHRAAHLSAPNMPWLTTTSQEAFYRPQFPTCGESPLGFYPILDSVEWCERLFPLGITTAQLRIKNLSGKTLSKAIQSAVALSKQYGVRLFINDAWQLAIEHGAYGVHLGQEDLDTADVHSIANARLRLGISTHCEAELARALTYRPSYVALGPIFPTDSKPMKFAEQGVERCGAWVNYAPVPVVAIGGIKLGNAKQVLEMSVSGIAVISAITKAEDPEGECGRWLGSMPR